MVVVDGGGGAGGGYDPSVNVVVLLDLDTE